jgi:hypothetical protein
VRRAGSREPERRREREYAVVVRTQTPAAARTNRIPSSEAPCLLLQRHASPTLAALRW